MMRCKILLSFYPYLQLHAFEVKEVKMLRDKKINFSKREKSDTQNCLNIGKIAQII